MKINFTINGVLDITNQEFTAKIASVETLGGEIITTHFLEFCDKNTFGLTTEEEIRTAAYAYGKQYYD